MHFFTNAGPNKAVPFLFTIVINSILNIARQPLSVIKATSEVSTEIFYVDHSNWWYLSGLISILRCLFDHTGRTVQLSSPKDGDNKCNISENNYIRIQVQIQQKMDNDPTNNVRELFRSLEPISTAYQLGKNRSIYIHWCLAVWGICTTVPYHHDSWTKIRKIKCVFFAPSASVSYFSS